MTDSSDPKRYTGAYILPTDSESRKQIPMFSGLLNYFPLALAAVARVSKKGNDKHNPGQPIHWARGTSMDHMDCVIRHAVDVETINPETGEYEDAQCLAWRALAKLQELEEKRLCQPPSRGSTTEPDSFPMSFADQGPPLAGGDVWPGDEPDESNTLPWVKCGAI